MTDLGYTPLFVPDADEQPFDDHRAFRFGDALSGTAARYVFDSDTTLAVNLALATGRPLLLRGHPGTGKTSLARSVADQLRWRFYSITVSSRTSARDLLWTVDSVARLADAQAGKDFVRHDAAYVKPGPLWWAFNADSAAWRGVPQDQRTDAQAHRGLMAEKDPSDVESARAVVLVDEIDKADPDVPNDLLQSFGSLRFRFDDDTIVVAEVPPLVVLTTNEERDLPRAFVRRCVVHTLQQPDPARLEAIARSHAGDGFDSDLYAKVVEQYRAVRARRIKDRQPPPSVAELLDVLAACQSLKTDPDAGSSWERVVRNLLDKATTIPDDEP